jgi:hypothetical protein
MSVEIPLDTMTLPEKLQALEAIWASLCVNPVDVTSPEWHGNILADRRQRLVSGQSSISEWSEAKRRLQDLGR